MAGMNVNGRQTRTIWPAGDERAVDIIDQTRLPCDYCVVRLRSLDDAIGAIGSMQVRGAPLIGVTAAYGVALALKHRADDARLRMAVDSLAATRPTAVNLHWALARMQRLLQALPPSVRADAAWHEAALLADEEVDRCFRIGRHGLSLLRACPRKSERLEVMTHCNAGWLASVDHGTALAPIYAAVAERVDVHVWVSETRPRNQGLLTAWELRQQGVPYTLIADNAAGWLMADGRVDLLLVGADRIAANGDVANKIGTYLKALAARAAKVPFCVAAPRSTIDFTCRNGAAIPIEERAADELRWVHGLDAKGELGRLRQVCDDASVANPAFDVTPAELVGALITERGSCLALPEALLALYPEAPHA